MNDLTSAKSHTDKDVHEKNNPSIDLVALSSPDATETLMKSYSTSEQKQTKRPTVVTSEKQAIKRTQNQHSINYNSYLNSRSLFLSTLSSSTTTTTTIKIRHNCTRPLSPYPNERRSSALPVEKSPFGSRLEKSDGKSSFELWANRGSELSPVNRVKTTSALLSDGQHHGENLEYGFESRMDLIHYPDDETLYHKGSHNSIIKSTNNQNQGQIDSERGNKRHSKISSHFINKSFGKPSRRFKDTHHNNASIMHTYYYHDYNKITPTDYYGKPYSSVDSKASGPVNMNANAIDVFDKTKRDDDTSISKQGNDNMNTNVKHYTNDNSNNIIKNSRESDSSSALKHSDLQQHTKSQQNQSSIGDGHKIRHYRIIKGDNKNKIRKDAKRILESDSKLIDHSSISDESDSDVVVDSDKPILKIAVREDGERFQSIPKFLQPQQDNTQHHQQHKRHQPLIHLRRHHKQWSLDHIMQTHRSFKSKPRRRRWGQKPWDNSNKPRLPSYSRSPPRSQPRSSSRSSLDRSKSRPVSFPVRNRPSLTSYRPRVSPNAQVSYAGFMQFVITLMAIARK